MNVWWEVLYVFFSEIYLSFQQWQNFENPLRIDNVIAMSLLLFWDTVYVRDRPTYDKRIKMMKINVKLNKSHIK